MRHQNETRRAGGAAGLGKLSFHAKRLEKTFPAWKRQGKIPRSRATDLCKIA
jgi:hypothetical protein